MPGAGNVTIDFETCKNWEGLNGERETTEANRRCGQPLGNELVTAEKEGTLPNTLSLSITR
jgi:hypothetical protein